MHIFLFFSFIYVLYTKHAVLQFACPIYKETPHSFLFVVKYSTECVGHNLLLLLFSISINAK